MARPVFLALAVEVALVDNIYFSTLRYTLQTNQFNSKLDDLRAPSAHGMKLSWKAVG
jgi:hypothetical protein